MSIKNTLENLLFSNKIAPMDVKDIKVQNSKLVWKNLKTTV